jgi:hypothetical protein
MTIKLLVADHEVAPGYERLAGTIKIVGEATSGSHLRWG